MVTSIHGEYDNTMADLLARRETAFVLWQTANHETPPRLIIGWVQPGTPIWLTGQQSLAMRPVPGFPDLWELPVSECNLVDGWVYYYWFEVSGLENGGVVRITDPLATAVDWRLLSEPGGYPASVIKFFGGRLVAADLGGEQPAYFGGPLPDALPANNRLVIYQLPTAWMRPGEGRDVSSFRDVISLLDESAAGATFSDLDVTRLGRAYLTTELGVNALELLPVADSSSNRASGYATTNYFAPDFEFGFPSTYSWPAPNRDLATLSGTCHSRGMRFIADMSMACSPDHPYFATSRDRFFNGSDAFRYEALEETYDPVSGICGQFSPARQLMKTAVDRWIRDFQIDGIRLDSVEQIQSEEFVQELREHARQRNYERFASLGIATSADERFIVFGKELSERQELLAQRRLDGLWHEAFKHYLRMALVGRQHESEPSFESTVRRAIDCRTFGFADLTQAVIYLTSHDVEGFRNERLFNFFLNSGVTDAEKRTKLAFTCLLTAVGTPMILAGDEFADRHDSFDENGNVSRHGGVEPVNFSRLKDDWRARIKTYVSRLIRLRTTYDALAVNDVEFIHVDFDDGKRVLVWRRGAADSDSQVIVVANFSDFTTPEANEPHAEYVIPDWPEAPAHKRWREVPQDRWVDPARAGREPIYSWEAKVYALFTPCLRPGVVTTGAANR